MVWGYSTLTLMVWGLQYTNTDGVGLQYTNTDGVGLQYTYINGVGFVNLHTAIMSRIATLISASSKDHVTIRVSHDVFSFLYV